jgi:hypothetical protein
MLCVSTPLLCSRTRRGGEEKSTTGLLCEVRSPLSWERHSPLPPRHQIESPKRPTKNSTQGRLPHNNNVSKIEFLRPQNGRWWSPSTIWRQTAALQKGSSGHAEYAAEEGAKGAACGAFISG